MFAMRNGIAWFGMQPGKAEETMRFYTRLFGWQFSDGEDYRVVSLPGRPVTGALFPAARDDDPAHFGVTVAGVEKHCRLAESVGGHVIVAPCHDDGTGITFAYLNDPSGNRVAISGPSPAPVDVPLLIAYTSEPGRAPVPRVRAAVS